MTVIGRDTTERLRDCAAVRGYVEKVCFKTGPPGMVGTELEWLVAFEGAPTEAVPIPLLTELVRVAGPPPRGSTLTYEPGGQVELSSRAFPGTTACWQALTEDAVHLRDALAVGGVVLLDTAIDPVRPPRRQLSHPRYDAMAAYFAAVADDRPDPGPVMMTSTASVQVNLDVGRDAEDAARRWRLLHAVGPTMVAAFANSPVHAGVDTGWRSARQRVWQGLDPSRTRAPAGPDPAAAWARYALDAPVMLERRTGANWRVDPGPTFHDWLTRPDAPTTDDLDCHLTTLFPPVRPRGWFEVRYLDQQPWRWWPVPVAVLTALLEDPVASAAALDAATGLDDWQAAARDGLQAPGLQQAAVACFDAALEAMTRSGEHPDLVALVRAFADRYPRRGRSPADDRPGDRLTDRPGDRPLEPPGDTSDPTWESR